MTTEAPVFTTRPVDWPTVADVYYGAMDADRGPDPLPDALWPNERGYVARGDDVVSFIVYGCEVARLPHEQADQQTIDLVLGAIRETVDRIGMLAIRPFPAPEDAEDFIILTGDGSVPDAIPYDAWRSGEDEAPSSKISSPEQETTT